MGVNKSDIELLTALRYHGHIGDGAAVVEIGAQLFSRSLLIAPEPIDAICAAFGAEPFRFGEATRDSTPDGRGDAQGSNASYARALWEWLGCSYAAIDVDGSPGAIPLDLNCDRTPPDMIGKFDVVTNCGTTEHIANQMNAFKVIHELCAPGGVMLHQLPAQGLMNHGLINYNPKFFWMLARSNGYKWLHADLRMETQADPIPADVIAEMQKFPTGFAERAEGYRTRDSRLFIVMQKWLDFPYAPPLDVPTGAAADNAEFKERYWTVFDPPRFQKAIEEIVARQTRG